MRSFRQFLEELWKNDIKEFPIRVGDKNYILRFFGTPTYIMFQYSPYKRGMIYEIVWFPADAAGQEDKYTRTGGNAIGDIRALLQALFAKMTETINQLKPVGFYFKSADAKLDRFWKKMPQLQNFPGYVKSRVKPNIFVQEQLQQVLDTEDFNDF